MAERAGHVRLVASGIRVSRGGTEVLRGVDLTLHGGERVALTGPSGSGKTVLLSLLAGLATPGAGSILLDGRPWPPTARPCGGAPVSSSRATASSRC